MLSLNLLTGYLLSLFINWISNIKLIEEKNEYLKKKKKVANNLLIMKYALKYIIKKKHSNNINDFSALVKFWLSILFAAKIFLFI